jgi:hypothetical protein
MPGYSKTPLARKLGIKPGRRIALLNAPPGFASNLGPLPDGATLLANPRQPADLTLWFVRNRRQLQRGIGARVAALGTDGLWIVWPKKSRNPATDIDRDGVRREGLRAGLVDFKIAAVDETWSGLKFTRRRE